MNPTMEQNLTNLIIDQQNENMRRDPLAEEDRALINGVIDRVFAYPTRKARAKDIFRCSDPDGLMTKLGFTPEQREALGKAELLLRVRDSKGESDSRRCTLIAVWHSETSFKTHIIQAFAAHKGEGGTDNSTLSAIIGETKTWRSADPGNAEYLDIVNILNAFPPEESGN